MKTGKIFLYVLFCLFLTSAAKTSEVSWIDGDQRPAAWIIDPCEPGQNDVITFSGPVGPHANSCFGMAALGGTPRISVDEVNKVVELWFEEPAPVICPFVWTPVCGLTGEFGPLAPGDWTFKSTQHYIAFEVPFTVTATGQIYYVDYDAPGMTPNGKSWKWAFHNLQDALDVATAGDTIFVAQGTYKPDEGSSVISGDRMAAFVPAPGVTLIGSCAGYGNPDPNLQNTDTTPTILTGDLNGDDSLILLKLSILNTDDNSYQVVRVSGGMSGGTVVLDGFTITGGQADGNDPANSGAGLNIDNSKVRLMNTTISDNVAGFGGGISCKNAELSMWNCIITGNDAKIFGGGLYNYSSDVDMTNCLMTGNSAFMEEFTGGSAIHNMGGNITILDSTIADNTDGTTPADGKAITSYAWKFPPDINFVAANSIFYDGGDEFVTNHPDSFFVSYCDVQGGAIGTGTGNINKNPQFNSPGQRDTNGKWSNGDYGLKSNSPCLDIGSNLLLPMDVHDLDKDTDISELLPIDLGSDKRVQNSVVDMGAYERGGTTPPPLPKLHNGGWINVPDVVSSVPVTLQSDPETYQFYLSFSAILTLDIIPVSAAGGTWSAWFDTDPGVVGPGNVTVTLVYKGENVDLTKLSPGEQQIAAITIWAYPL